MNILLFSDDPASSASQVAMILMLVAICTTIATLYTVSQRRRTVLAPHPTPTHSTLNTRIHVLSLSRPPLLPMVVHLSRQGQSAVSLCHTVSPIRFENAQRVSSVHLSPLQHTLSPQRSARADSGTLDTLPLTASEPFHVSSACLVHVPKLPAKRRNNSEHLRRSFAATLKERSRGTVWSTSPQQQQQQQPHQQPHSNGTYTVLCMCIFRKIFFMMREASFCAISLCRQQDTNLSH